VLSRNGVAAEEVLKLSEMTRGDAAEHRRPIISGGIDLILNTPRASSGASTRETVTHLTAAVLPTSLSSVPGLAAATQGIEALQRGEVEVRSLQEWAAR
jgi:carbamoyl-phosphate synthase large subunit